MLNYNKALQYSFKIQNLEFNIIFDIFVILNSSSGN